VKKRADVVEAEDEPALQRRIVEDRAVLAEISEIGERIVQLRGYAEEEFVAFSGIRHDSSVDSLESRRSRGRGLDEPAPPKPLEGARDRRARRRRALRIAADEIFVAFAAVSHGELEEWHELYGVEVPDAARMVGRDDRRARDDVPILGGYARPSPSRRGAAGSSSGQKRAAR
jgi:hypothetical protein